MSYDVTFFVLQPGESPEEAIDRLEEELLAGKGPQAGSATESLHRALLQRIPALEASGIGHLMHPALALELDLSDSGGSVGLAYHHRGAAAKQAVDLLLDAVEVLVAHGWTAYDQQLGQPVDPARDREAVLRMYQEGVGLTDGIRAEVLANPLSAPSTRKRPWWRFW